MPPRRQYTRAEIADLMRQAGWEEKYIPTMSAVFYGESSGKSWAHNPDASTGDNSYGLAQINMLGKLGPDRQRRYGIKRNEDLFDPIYNLKIARRVFQDEGPKAWTIWKNGVYRKYMAPGENDPIPAPKGKAIRQTGKSAVGTTDLTAPGEPSEITPAPELSFPTPPPPAPSTPISQLRVPPKPSMDMPLTDASLYRPRPPVQYTPPAPTTSMAPAPITMEPDQVAVEEGTSAGITTPTTVIPPRTGQTPAVKPPAVKKMPAPGAAATPQTPATTAPQAPGTAPTTTAAAPPEAIPAAAPAAAPTATPAAAPLTAALPAETPVSQPPTTVAEATIASQVPSYTPPQGPTEVLDKETQYRGFLATTNQGDTPEARQMFESAYAEAMDAGRRQAAPPKKYEEEYIYRGPKEVKKVYEFWLDNTVALYQRMYPGLDQTYIREYFKNYGLADLSRRQWIDKDYVGKQRDFVVTSSFNSDDAEAIKELQDARETEKAQILAKRRTGAPFSQMDEAILANTSFNPSDLQAVESDAKIKEDEHLAKAKEFTGKFWEPWGRVLSPYDAYMLAAADMGWIPYDKAKEAVDEEKARVDSEIQKLIERDKQVKTPISPLAGVSQMRAGMVPPSAPVPMSADEARARLMKALAEEGVLSFGQLDGKRAAEARARAAREARIREKQAMQPLYLPIQFGKSVVGGVAKLVPSIFEFAQFANVQFNPALRAYYATEAGQKRLQEGAQATERMRKAIDEQFSMVDPDLQEDTFIRVIPEAIGQIMGQLVLTAASGGGNLATMVVGAALGGGSTYAEAARGGSKLAPELGLVGAIAAVPDALLMNKYLAPLRGEARAGFIENLVTSVFRNTKGELGTGRALEAARATLIGSLNTLKDMGVEGAQELSEKKINDITAALTYDPKRKIFTIDKEDIQTFIGGMAGGAAGSRIGAIGGANLQQQDVGFENPLKEYNYTPNSAIVETPEGRGLLGGMRRDGTAAVLIVPETQGETAAEPREVFVPQRDVTILRPEITPEEETAQVPTAAPQITLPDGQTLDIRQQFAQELSGVNPADPTSITDLVAQKQAELDAAITNNEAPEIRAQLQQEIDALQDPELLRQARNIAMPAKADEVSGAIRLKRAGRQKGILSPKYVGETQETNGVQVTEFKIQDKKGGFGGPTLTTEKLKQAIDLSPEDQQRVDRLAATTPNAEWLVVGSYETADGRTALNIELWDKKGKSAIESNVIIGDTDLVNQANDVTSPALQTPRVIEGDGRRIVAHQTQVDGVTSTRYLEEDTDGAKQFNDPVYPLDAAAQVFNLDSDWVAQAEADGVENIELIETRESSDGRSALMIRPQVAGGATLDTLIFGDDSLFATDAPTDTAAWTPMKGTAPVQTPAQAPAPEVAQEEVAALAADWDRANKGRQSDEWFEGGNVTAREGFAEAAANGADQLQAHGMAKDGTLSGAVKSLFDLLTNGLDPTRGNGRLDTAPLATSETNLGAGLGTAGGTAARDGAFLLVQRPGTDGLTGALDNLGAILVNDAHPEIVAKLREAIQQLRPDVIVDTFSNAGTVTQQLNPAETPTETKPSISSAPVPTPLSKSGLREGDMLVHKDGSMAQVAKASDGQFYIFKREKDGNTTRHGLDKANEYEKADIEKLRGRNVELPDIFTPTEQFEPSQEPAPTEPTTLSPGHTDAIVAADALIKSMPDSTHKKRVQKALQILKDAKTEIDVLNAVQNLRNQITAPAKYAEMTPQQWGKVTKPVKTALTQLEADMAAAGYEISTEIQPGKPYNIGLNVDPEFVNDETLPAGTEVIKTVRKPTILKDGKLIQAGQIVVAQNITDESVAKEQADWAAKEAAAQEEQAAPQEEQAAAEAPVTEEAVEEEKAPEEPKTKQEQQNPLKRVLDLFAPTAFTRAEEGPKSRRKIIMMPIDDFLALVPPVEGQPKPEAAAALKAGIQWESLPMLGIETEGAVSTVTSHEGRHRAAALKAAGHTMMPVIIRDAGIRWSEQGNPMSRDYEEGFPETIQNEDGSFQRAFPFNRSSALLTFDINKPESALPAIASKRGRKKAEKKPLVAEFVDDEGNIVATAGEGDTVYRLNKNGDYMMAKGEPITGIIEVEDGVLVARYTYRGTEYTQGIEGGPWTVTSPFEAEQAPAQEEAAPETAAEVQEEAPKKKGKKGAKATVNPNAAGVERKVETPRTRGELVFNAVMDALAAGKTIVVGTRTKATSFNGEREGMSDLFRIGSDGMLYVRRGKNSEAVFDESLAGIAAQLGVPASEYNALPEAIKQEEKVEAPPKLIEAEYKPGVAPKTGWENPKAWVYVTHPKFGPGRVVMETLEGDLFLANEQEETGEFPVNEITFAYATDRSGDANVIERNTRQPKSQQALKETAPPAVPATISDVWSRISDMETVSVETFTDMGLSTGDAIEIIKWLQGQKILGLRSKKTNLYPVKSASESALTAMTDADKAMRMAKTPDEVVENAEKRIYTPGREPESGWVDKNSWTWVDHPEFGPVKVIKATTNKKTGETTLTIEVGEETETVSATDITFLYALEKGTDIVLEANGEYGGSTPLKMARRKAANRDQEYMDAVNRGDMDMAQQLVNEAAQAAGFTIGPVFHYGTFDPNRARTLDTINGVHFGTFKASMDLMTWKTRDAFFRGVVVEFDEVSQKWNWRYDYPAREAGKPSPIPLEAGQDGFLTKGAAYTDLNDFIDDYVKDIPQGIIDGWGKLTSVFLNPADMEGRTDHGQDWSPVVADTRPRGINLVWYANRYEDQGSTSYMVLDPRIAKSSDPVVYDQDGKVIPLSKRFDITSAEILKMARAKSENGKQTTAKQKAFTEENIKKAKVQKTEIGLKLNAPMANIVEMVVNETFNDEGAFEGMFLHGEFADSKGNLTKSQVDTLLEGLKNKAQEMKDAGRKDAATRLLSFAKTLKQNRDSQGSIIIYASDEAIVHERLHYLSFSAAVDKTLQGRHDPTLFKKLIEHPAMQKAWTAFFGKPGHGFVNGTRTRKMAPGDKAKLVEEIAITSASGRFGDIGLTADEAADFLDTWYESYIKRNGEQSLDQFAKEVTFGKEIIDQVKERLNNVVDPTGVDQNVSDILADSESETETSSQRPAGSPATAENLRGAGVVPSEDRSRPTGIGNITQIEAYAQADKLLNQGIDKAFDLIMQGLNERGLPGYNITAISYAAFDLQRTLTQMPQREEQLKALTKAILEYRQYAGQLFASFQQLYAYDEDWTRERIAEVYLSLHGEPASEELLDSYEQAQKELEAAKREGKTIERFKYAELDSNQQLVDEINDTEAALAAAETPDLTINDETLVKAVEENNQRRRTQKDIDAQYKAWEAKKKTVAETIKSIAERFKKTIEKRASDVLKMARISPESETPLLTKDEYDAVVAHFGMEFGKRLDEVDPEEMISAINDLFGGAMDPLTVASIHADIVNAMRPAEHYGKDIPKSVSTKRKGHYTIADRVQAGTSRDASAVADAILADDPQESQRLKGIEEAKKKGEEIEQQIRQKREEAEAIEGNSKAANKKRTKFADEIMSLESDKQAWIKQHIDLQRKTHPRRRLIMAIVNQAGSPDAIIAALKRNELPPAQVIKWLQNTRGLTEQQAAKVLREADQIFEQAKLDLKRNILEAKSNLKLSDAEVLKITKQENANRNRQQKANKNWRDAMTMLSKSKKGMFFDAFINYGKANLLLHPQTHLMNLSSNIGEQVADILVNLVATPADIAFAKAMGTQRTSAVNLRGVVQGFMALARKDPAFNALLKARYESEKEKGFGAIDDFIEQSAWSMAKGIVLKGDAADELAQLNLGESNVQLAFNSRPGQLAGRLIDGFINQSFRTLQAEDALFKVYAFRKVLNELSEIMAKNDVQTEQYQGISWKERQKQILKDPPASMAIMAQMYSDEMTFQNDNVISEYIRGIKTKGYSDTEMSFSWVAARAIDFFVPFDRTPTNLVIRGLEYSPVGILRALDEFMMARNAAIGKKTKRLEKRKDKYRAYFLDALNYDLDKNNAGFARLTKEEQALIVEAAVEQVTQFVSQRRFATAVGRTVIGSSAMALGAYLGIIGILYGIVHLGDDDKEERELMFANKALGANPGSIGVGGTRFLLPQTPMFRTMAYGATVAEEYQRLGKNYPGSPISRGVSTAATYGLENIKDLPLSRALLDLTGPRGSFGGFVGNTTARYVPASRITASFAEAFDDVQRRRSPLTEAMRKKLPQNEQNVYGYFMRDFQNTFGSKLPYFRWKGLPGQAPSLPLTTGALPKKVRGGKLDILFREMDPFDIGPDFGLAKPGKKRKVEGKKFGGKKIEKKKLKD